LQKFKAQSLNCPIGLDFSNFVLKFGSLALYLQKRAPTPSKEKVIIMVDDNIQHGIDDDPKNDAEKGAALGGLGGAAVGAVAGAATGPVGAVIGALAGGLAGAGASGAAVAAVDNVDNDNNITGLGDGVTRDVEDQANDVTRNVADVNADTIGNGVPGVQTGGTALDGTPDTRGLTEKAADALTGDKTDDNTAKRVD
jgi:phage tail tape-measure protein